MVLAGGVVYLIRHGSAAPDYHAFRSEPADLRTVPGIVAVTLMGRGRGIIQLGLLLLIATPIVRVAFSLVAFSLERDRTYVVVTLIVLAILLYGLAGGGL